MPKGRSDCRLAARLLTRSGHQRQPPATLLPAFSLFRRLKAERQGFEPWDPVSQVNSLGVRHTKAAGATSAGESSDAVAFGQLFGRHAQAVYAFCARRTSDLALAEDLTSITFLEAWRHRERVPSEDIEHRGVQGATEAVRRQYVKPAITHVGRKIDHRVEDGLHRRANTLAGGAATCRACRTGRADQIEEVGAFGLVELQGPGDAFEDILRNSVGASTFQPGVVLDADASKKSDLLSAQPLDSPPLAVGGQPGELGRDPRPSRDQEIADVVSHVHCHPRYGPRRSQGSPCQYPYQPGLPATAQPWLGGLEALKRATRSRSHITQ